MHEIRIRGDELEIDAVLSRRDFLRGGGLAIGSCALMPRGRRPAPASGPPERSVILLLLVGGPSQLETFDPKPDATAEVRGPFGSIATRVPGIRVSEHLPRLAARMDRVAVVRSVHHDAAPVHETGYQLLQTGRLCRSGEEFPHFGSVIYDIEAYDPQILRPSPVPVILPGPIRSTGIDIPHGQSAGGLGPEAEPIFLRPDAAGVDLAERLEHSAANYGPSAFGRNCRLARYLIESGVRAVTVNMFDTVFDRATWDCHGSSPFSTFEDYARDLLPAFDRAFAALLDDLERSGRLESTLVVAAGEFGRSPRINAAGGRDHWPGVWSVLLAGGGVNGGQVIGSSDARAAEPADRPVTLPDLLATIYHSLGIHPRTAIHDTAGRWMYLVEDGQVIGELFA